MNMKGDSRAKLLIYLMWLVGGAGKAAVQYANVLANDGTRVVIVASRADPALLGQLDARIELRIMGVKRSLLAVGHLRRGLREVRPDILFAIGVGNVLPLQLALTGARYDCPLIVRETNSPEGLLSSYGPIKRAAKRLAMRSAYRTAKQLIVLTRSMEAELRHDWQVPAEKLSYVPNGVALPQNAPERRPADPAMILSVGRLVPQKDHETLLQAFAQVRRDRECRLVLAGDGRERMRLERAAFNLGIHDDVTFLGRVADVAPLYQQARVTVLASRYEGFPNVLIEALAYGCPVVATDCPTGPAEVINSPSVGLLAGVGNAGELARRMEEALEQTYEPDELRARAADFSLVVLNERISRLFKRLSKMS
ncbi:glycosyltransferase [Thioalkalivibrio sp. ALRh]|uniref:glycosyltransferase n=1 Tax=Thioalkalivibrio sp. ALRh TaxID=1266911 RepID=UPI0009DA57C5|nr:glycosyltransferase [Thioalkalivibrio sp. ALRh]